MSELFIVIVLGVIEGLTEFIPVSSTGHLILAGNALGFTGAKAHLFEVFIQFGAVLAVLVLYRERFLGLFKFGDSLSSNSFRGISGILKIGICTVPILITGFLFHSYIKSHLFNTISVSVGLIVGGILMIVVERREPSYRFEKIEDLPLYLCALVGLFQCLALWPGVSRAGATIVGGLVLGLRRTVAAEFSFIVAAPVLGAAVLFDMVKNYSLLSSDDFAFFGVGLAVSFITAMLAIRFFLGLLRRWTLVPFGVYRIFFGFLCLFLAW